MQKNFILYFLIFFNLFNLFYEIELFSIILSINNYESTKKIINK